MRRVISIMMVIFGLTTIAGGIWKLFPPFNKMFYVPHITSAFLFSVLLIIHIWLNRKPLLRYFQRLKWWWVLVSLGIATFAWLGIGLPIVLGNR
jgi:heme A synthase